MSSKNLRAAFAVLVSLIVTRPAAAGTLGVAGDYNAFIFNNLSSAGGDTEGRLAVGNNFTASSYGVGIALNAIQQNGGEFHNHPFTGNVPAPPAVPEPISVVLLLVGAVAGLASGRRR